MANDMQERRFSAWGQTLAGWFRPGEGTPVLALHGWLDNANSFCALARHLPNPLLAMDFAGHGYSDHRPDGAATHYVDHVRDVLAVADDMQWKRFILLGHSMGAGVASLFAGSFPERLEKLVLLEGLGPPTTAGESAAATLRKAIDDMLALPDKKKPVYARFDDAVQARTAGFGGLDPDSCRLLCERGLEQVPGGWTWRTDARLRLTSSLRLTEDQVEGFMRAITVPTLLVTAEQGMGGNGMFDHRTAWLSDLEQVRLPGRHHVHMEQAAAVAAPVARFLAQ
jgi:pimeloyl-ACP methyl ester carboxylesterase